MSQSLKEILWLCNTLHVFHHPSWDFRFCMLVKEYCGGILSRKIQLINYSAEGSRHVTPRHANCLDFWALLLWFNPGCFMLVESLSHGDRVAFMKSPLPTLLCLMTFPFHAAWQAVRVFFSAYSAPLWHFRLLFWSLLFICSAWWSLDTFTFLSQ